MTRFSRACLPLVLGFVAFTLDSLWNFIDPAHPIATRAPIATAHAATACAIPSVEALAREWTVQSVACDGDCAVGHVAKGDKFTFTREYGDKPSFSLSVRPSAALRASAKTEGATLAGDGVGNVRGPIVFGHNLLDGSPLQLHWIIVQVRAYDLSGDGDCALRARVEVCEAEPASGATSCSARQHNGVVHLGG